MRPTFSIIFFTVMSGAGYGLWFLIGLGIVLSGPGFDPGGEIASMAGPGLLPWGLVAGFVLVSVGLLSSLLHLGKPGRAWRAFSQWRSSWLSREGVAAVLTYLPAAALIGAIAHDHWLAPSARLRGPAESWVWMTHPTTLIAGVLLLIGALATVFCTANIYASIKPVRAWHNRYVVVGYLLLALHSGALFAWALSAYPGGGTGNRTQLPILVLLTAVAAALLKIRYWRQVDEPTTLSTGGAIGLASFGQVRSFEHPHTEENYLTQEMGFRVARKHAGKLRRISVITGFVLPALLALSSLLLPSLGAPAAWLALLAGMLGMHVERWLFFAEAKHLVMLYYGARTTESSM